MKKIFVIILIALFIINIIAGAFLFLDIRILKAPIISIELDPVTMTPSDLVVQATIHITNPNPFDVSVENLKMISFAKDGYEIGRFSIPGGDIPANQNKTFIAQDNLGFNGHDYTRIQNTITADITISALSIIKKTIPFEMKVDASLTNITNSLAVPIVHLQVTPDDITTDGVHFSGTIDLYNPNLFEITAEDLSLTLKNENNESLGNALLQGGLLEPAGYLTRPFNATVLYKALDATSINATFSGIIGAIAAGINKTLPFSVETRINVPDLLKLLSLNGTFDFNLTGNFKLRIRGIICYIDFSIYNPSKIPLDVRDLVCSIYRLDKNTSRLLGRQNMTPCTVKPKQEECVGTSIVLHYSQFLFSGARRFLPDWFILSIKGNVSITGVHQALPIAVTGYLEPHFIFNATAAPRLHG
jgi:LEA14-like dessication related protein